MEKSILIFGAGNIGRSFIALVFSRAGYRVIFTDINQSLVSQLNCQKRYHIIVKNVESPDSTIEVAPVSAILSSDRSSISAAIQNADLIATSVGLNALPPVFPVLTEGLMVRKRPVDIIIAENIHDGASYFRNGLRQSGLPETLLAQTGLVETSIGKMVPLAKKADLDEDPLRVVAEAYNTLIVDRNGFVNPVPEIPDLLPVEPISAYVDRKLYIHNMGHSATAYLGFLYHPEKEFIWEMLADPQIEALVYQAMTEVATALIAEYPQVFTVESLDEYILDLIRRFKNQKLGDTVYRVGRDLYRKLAPSDRLQGAMDLINRHHLTSNTLNQIIFAALHFNKVDADGSLFPRDQGFLQAVQIVRTLQERGIKI